MKTIITFFIFIGVFTLNAQIFYQENFENLMVGPIVGQSNYKNFAYPDSNYYEYVVLKTENGNVLSLKGSEIDLSKGDLNLQRNPGNNVIQIEYDYFTGPINTEINSFGGIVLYDDYRDGKFGLQMESATKRIVGCSHYWGVPIDYTPVGDNNFDVYLPANTWVRLGFAYPIGKNYYNVKGPGFYKELYSIGSNKPYTSFDVAYWVTDGISSHIFDNVVAKFVNTENLLNVIDDTYTATEFTIHPNPTTNYLNIVTNKKILNAYIYDLSGIRQEFKIENGKINVKILPIGSYILGLKTESGFISKKFIKK